MRFLHFSRFRCFFVLLIVISCLTEGIRVANGQDKALDSPRQTVTRWIELHLSREHDAAAKLTTGSRLHRVHGSLIRSSDARMVISKSLGNDRTAAVVVEKWKRRGKDANVFLFWLVRHDDGWRINKSDRLDEGVADERLHGFLEADKVNWHLQSKDLWDVWQAGPGTPPIGGGICCGSELVLRRDGTFEFVEWGPGGPSPETDDRIRGTWKASNGRIKFSTDGGNFESRIAWLYEDELVLESADGKGQSTYERRMKFD